MAPYNPLEKRHLAESIQRRILATPVFGLGDRSARAATNGAGVYVLYYAGDFPEYVAVADANRDDKWSAPIYVGKAIPSGGRIGGLDAAAIATRALRDRLRRHEQSIEAVSNLDIRDFGFRYLVVDDVFIPLGENMLIETFKPLWNVVLAGFGNNPTGGPRSTQAMSHWDTLHPGRGGAGTAAGAEIAHVKSLIRRYFETAADASR